MSKLPKSLGILGGIAVFYMAQLLCLLRGNPPFCSMKRAALCALGLAVLTWLCAQVAIGVLREGLSNPEERA